MFCRNCQGLGDVTYKTTVTQYPPEMMEAWLQTRCMFNQPSAVTPEQVRATQAAQQATAAQQASDTAARKQKIREAAQRFAVPVLLALLVGG